jgi:type II secretory pathway pseudopilin PulG
MSNRCRPARRGFTIVELLTVFFVIAVIAGLLLPALSGAFGVGREAKSIARLRQIATWSSNYTSDNRDRVLPSQFDYSGPEYDNSFRGNVRSVVATEGVAFQGTWTDILWTENSLATFPVEGPGGAIVDEGGVRADQYLYDSPDANFYERMADLVSWTPANDDVLRSAERNSRNAPVAEADAGPRPYGLGAREVGLPGYFAANDFFDASAVEPDVRTKFGFWSLAQIRQPEISLYAVDSAYGEVIPATPAAWELIDSEPGPDAEIDQRYGNTVLMLFLDGSVRGIGDWRGLDQLEDGRGSGRVRVRNLADRFGADAVPGDLDP